MLMMAVHSFAQEESPLFGRLQGLTTLVSQQVVELSNLSKSLFRSVSGKGPLLQSEPNAMIETAADFAGHVAIGLLAEPISNVENFVRGLASFSSTKLDETLTENGARLYALQFVCAGLFLAAFQVTFITVEQSSANERANATNPLPPVMPHELVK